MTPEEITKLAEEYANKTVSVRHTTAIVADEAEDVISWLLRTHCIVGKEFVKRQRLVIEYDKKLMLEKPIGEKIALAGVYQAKLELMDKLFGTDTLDETDK